MSVRPTLNFLNEELIRQIIDEARDLLKQVGVQIYDDDVIQILSDNGASADKSTRSVKIPGDLIDRALKTVPPSFQLYDTVGNQTHDFSGYNTYFTPASSSLKILDPDSGEHRSPATNDYIRFVKVADQMKHIASQSTAFVPQDVHETISDSYRLYLNLLFSAKPVVTGTFSENGVPVMKEMQLAVRGSEEELKKKPLTVFSCCSTTPLKWSKEICSDIKNLGAAGIPIQLIAMPLTGFTAPVTLVGSLTGHTAELLSGIVISQITNPGAPLMFGGAPSAFEVRFQTTPMGSIETMMMDCGYNEIGKYLNIPTQAYIGLSDAKALDAQAGLESSLGAAMAVLSGINSISGPGMLDFVNCFSTEKLVLDNEICGMTFRMARGMDIKETFPIVPHYQELQKVEHLLISKHSRKYLRDEHIFPGPVIDRASYERWQEKGSLTLHQRAKNEADKLVESYQPSPLSGDVKSELTSIMEKAAKECGMDRLPKLD